MVGVGDELLPLGIDYEVHALEGNYSDQAFVPQDDRFRQKGAIGEVNVDAAQSRN